MGALKCLAISTARALLPDPVGPPTTISVPRLKRADDIDPDTFDNGIDDDTFAKICALIRISVPYTGMIISTRESKAVREKVLPLGVSQISGASRTSVGGYAEPETEEEVTSAQFDVSDNRTLDEVVNLTAFKRFRYTIAIYPAKVTFFIQFPTGIRTD